MHWVYITSGLVLTFIHMAGLVGLDSIDTYHASNHTIEGLTRDVYVKPLHSHNDYWRPQPLFDALSVGAVSVEADVWVVPGLKLERKDSTYNFVDDIYVGHSEVFLQPQNTLNNLYLDPLYEFLQDSNPKGAAPHDKYLVFWNSPETPLYFWLDFKTDANVTYPAVTKYFQRFIDDGLLAYYDTKEDKHVAGPLIVTITGNLPTDEVKGEEKRYFYLDAPLAKLDLDDWGKLSVVALGSLELVIGDETPKEGFSDTQKDKLKLAFDYAHKKGLKTRIWGDLTWPVLVRDQHLHELYALGTDLLNVDDLKHAAALL